MTMTLRTDEICADCGKPIFGGQGSYYSKHPHEDIGRAYHSQCGDPFGLRARDTKIAQLKARIERLCAALTAADAIAHGITDLVNEARADGEAASK